MDSCSFYILGYNSMLLLFILLLQLVRLTIGSSSVVSFTPLIHLIFAGCDVRCVYVLSISLVSGITKYSRLIMYISCPNPRTSHPQGVWFPLLDNSVRNQEPRAGCVHSFWYVIDSRSSQPAVQGNVFMCAC